MNDRGAGGNGLRLCMAHHRPMLEGNWEGDWCGFYVPELGAGEDYGCWSDEGETDGDY